MIFMDIFHVQKLHGDLSSLHAQSAGEDSNSSDTEPSDRGDGPHDGTTMDSLDNQRSHTFPSAFLGLQGISGLLPGPSGMAANDFGKSKNAFNNFFFVFFFSKYYSLLFKKKSFTYI